MEDKKREKTKTLFTCNLNFVIVLCYYNLFLTIWTFNYSTLLLQFVTNNLDLIIVPCYYHNRTKIIRKFRYNNRESLLMLFHFFHLNDTFTRDSSALN